MNIQAASHESRHMGSRPLAARDRLRDTIAMINSPSVTKTGQRSMIRQLEYRLISIGMSVIAYLLERAVLRSIKRGATGL